MRSRIQCRNKFAETIVNWLRRKTLILSTEYSQRCMIANAENVVLCIPQKQIIVIGVRAISWIREPEVLPYNDAIPIGSFIECFVARLPNPVADHVEMLVTVIP